MKASGNVETRWFPAFFRPGPNRVRPLALVRKQVAADRYQFFGDKEPALCLFNHSG